MNIILKRLAAKELKNLQRFERNKITKKLLALKVYPLAGKPLLGKYKGFYSLRAWPYRIIYQVVKNAIFIYSIKHRQGAYKS